MPRRVEEVRFRIEWVRDGVSSGRAAVRRGEGGWTCAGGEVWKGRRGLGRMMWGTGDAMLLLLLLRNVGGGLSSW